MNLDRLAAPGMKQTGFYAPSSTCTPTRAELLTGSCAPGVGLPSVLFPFATTGIADSETTIAELLQGRGYATALVGKWHLGHPPPFLPTRHGFDSFHGIPYPNDFEPVRVIWGWGGRARLSPAVAAALSRREGDRGADRPRDPAPPHDGGGGAVHPGEQGPSLLPAPGSGGDALLCVPLVRGFTRDCGACCDASEPRTPRGDTCCEAARTRRGRGACASVRWRGGRDASPRAR
jgi:hypothetical protein